MDRSQALFRLSALALSEARKALRLIALKQGPKGDKGDTGKGEKGDPGPPGPGISLDDLSMDLNDRTLNFRFMQGGKVVKTDSIKVQGLTIYRGVFAQDAAYELGDMVTYGGSLWHCQKDNPEGAPGTSADWRLAVKRGRDGNDAKVDPNVKADRTYSKAQLRELAKLIDEARQDGHLK